MAPEAVPDRERVESRPSNQRTQFAQPAEWGAALIPRESVPVPQWRHLGAAGGRGDVDQPSHSARIADGAAVARTASDVAALSRMTGAELAEKYLDLFGQPARSRNKVFLRKRVRWRQSRQ